MALRRDVVPMAVPARVASLLDQAEAGSGACLVVERGEDAPLFPDAVVTEGERRRFSVRRAVCSPHPYAAFEVVCELLQVDVASPEADEIRRRGTGLAALRDLATRLAPLDQRSPSLMVVDRAERADTASARCLSYLARHLEGRSLSLALVAVAVTAGSWLDDLAVHDDSGPHRLPGAYGDGPGHDVVRAVLSRLDDGDRRVVDALAVLGPAASVAAVAAVSEVPLDTVLPILDRLLEWGLLRRTGTGAGQLVAEGAVLGQLPPTRGADLHARAAAHARSTGESALRVAAHLEQTAPATFPWASATLRSGAGLELRAGDAARAVRWLRRALEEDSAAGVDVTVPVLLELAKAQVVAGDPGAAGSLRLAIDATDGEQRRALQIRLGRQLSQTGRVHEAVDLLDGVLSELDPDDTAHAVTRMQLHAGLVAACRVSLQLRERSAGLLEQLTADLATCGSDDPTVLGELAYEHSLAGTDRQVVIDLGARVLRGFGHASPAPEASHVLFLALVWAEDMVGARLLCDRLHGESQPGPLEAHRRATIALAEGDLDHAVEMARAAVADIEWVAPVLVSGARAQLARALIRQGDLDAAAAALRLPGGDSPWRDRVTYHPLLLAHAELAAARGEWRRAASHAESCAEFSNSMGTRNPAVVPWHAVAARALAELGRPAEAEALLADAVERARAFGAPGILAALVAAADALHPGAPAPTAERTILRLLGDTGVVRPGGEQHLGDDLVDRTVCIVGLAEHGLHDEQLCEHLWPEGDPAVGRNRLRNVLLRVRQRHGPVVVRHGRTVALADHVTVDVHEFDRLAAASLAAGDAETSEALGREALDLYRGDLCPPHPFEPWASGPRAVIRQRWLAVLDRLAALATARGDLATAMTWFEQAIAADPWDEDRYLDAADGLLAAGRPAAARSLLQRCGSVCVELGVPPSARHRALADATR